MPSSTPREKNSSLERIADMRGFFLLLSLLLAACGGGGGGESAPPEIVPPRTGAPGQVDATFAQAGMFVFPAARLPNAYTSAHSAARLESGKLVLSGAYTDSRVNPLALRTGLLVRLLPGGALDTSLLGTGYLQLTGSLVESVVETRLAPLSLERVLWTHFTSRLCGPAPICPSDPENEHVYVRRMNAEGRGESTYGTGGTAVGHLRGWDVAAAPDGSMVIFGDRILPIGSGPSTAREVIALDPDGAPIPGARLPTPPPGTCPLEAGDPPQIRAARQPDGKFVAMWGRGLSSGE